MAGVLRQRCVFAALVASCAPPPPPPTAAAAAPTGDGGGSDAAAPPPPRRRVSAQSAALELHPAECRLRVALGARGVVWAVVDVTVDAASGAPVPAVAHAEPAAAVALTAAAAEALGARLSVPHMLARLVDAELAGGGGGGGGGGASAQPPAKRARLEL
jgi:hypothetical protein